MTGYFHGNLNRGSPVRLIYYQSSTAFMDTERVLKHMKSVAGVHGAMVLDSETIAEVSAMEEGVTDTSFGMPLDNRALEACRKKAVWLCLFCDYTFEQPTDHVMLMEDENGNVIGFDIPPGKQDSFIDREDLVWLSDDFVLKGDAEGDVSKVVMMPQKLSCIGSEAGVKDAIVFYPNTATDGHLRDKLEYKDEAPGIASAIMAFDWL